MPSLLLMAAFIYFNGIGVKAAGNPPICEEVCTEATDCTETCYINMMEFENGNDIDCLEYGVYNYDYCCGDDTCGVEEDGDQCPGDCSLGLTGDDPPTCGNSTCDVGESRRNCPSDCPLYDYCGDGICDGPGVGGSESAGNCPGDCLYSDFCNAGPWSCDGWYSCRSNRCTYDPLAPTCDTSFNCNVDQKCIGKTNTTPGMCVTVFF